MSLLLTGVILGGAGGLWVFGRRWLAARRALAPVALPAAPEATTAEAVPPLVGFDCQLGDVLTRVTGEEAWLAGAIVLSEEVPVAVLFLAPDRGRDVAVYVRARPRTGLYWLAPLDANAVLVGGEPPSVVEHEGVRFERSRRLPLRARRIGTGTPDLGDAVIVAEYASAGSDRLLVLKGNAGAVHAYRGVEVEDGAYEVIASGSATLR